MKNKG